MMAEAEGVSGLLYRRLKRCPPGSVPIPILRRLHNKTLEIATASKELQGLAQSISKRFHQEGVDTMALQGLSLLNLYPDPGLRPLGDMDILVKPSDRNRIPLLLAELGFGVPDPEYPNIFYNNRHWLDIHSHALNLDRVNTRRYLFPSDLTLLWESATLQAENSSHLLIADPRDNVVLLSAHALKHAYSRLIWLVDLHESILKLVASDKNGWDAMVSRAQRWHQEKSVLYGLIMLQGTFGFNSPKWVLKTLGIHRLTAAEKYLLRLKRKGFTSSLWCPLMNLFSIKGIGNRLKFGWENLFPRQDVMAQIFVNHPGKSRAMLMVPRTIYFLKSIWMDALQAFRTTSRQ
jgi:hypothetical protein